MRSQRILELAYALGASMQHLWHRARGTENKAWTHTKWRLKSKTPISSQERKLSADKIERSYPTKRARELTTCLSCLSLSLGEKRKRRTGLLWGLQTEAHTHTTYLCSPQHPKPIIYFQMVLTPNIQEKEIEITS